MLCGVPQVVNKQVMGENGRMQNALQPDRHFELDAVRRNATLSEAGMRRALQLISAHPLPFLFRVLGALFCLRLLGLAAPLDHLCSGCLQLTNRTLQLA